MKREKMTVYGKWKKWEAVLEVWKRNWINKKLVWIKGKMYRGWLFS